MKKLFVCLPVILALLATNIAYGKCKIEDETDEFTKVRGVYQVKNFTRNKSASLAMNLYFFPEKGIFEAELKYTGSGRWLFVSETDNALRFLVGDEVLEFPVEYVMRDVIDLGSLAAAARRSGYPSVYTVERFIVPISLEQINKLAAASNLKCRVYGKNYYSEFDDMKKMQKCWGEFLAHIKASF